MIAEGILAQADWNSQAKKPSEPLSAKARELREEARRALLAAFAPTMVLNDWADQQGHGPRVAPPPDLHPVAAAGVVEWVEGTKPFPHDVWLTIWRAYPSIKAATRGE